MNAYALRPRPSAYPFTCPQHTQEFLYIYRGQKRELFQSHEQLDPSAPSIVPKYSLSCDETYQWLVDSSNGCFSQAHFSKTKRNQYVQLVPFNSAKIKLFFDFRLKRKEYAGR